MRATALLTGAEMNPGSADLDALLALPSFGVLDAGNGLDVDTTLIGHDIFTVEAPDAQTRRRSTLRRRRTPRA